MNRLRRQMNVHAAVFQLLLLLTVVGFMAECGIAFPASGLQKRGLTLYDTIPVHDDSIAPATNREHLQRWRIHASGIPPKTGVVQKEPSIWEWYQWTPIAVFSLCILEAMLIVALLIHRAGRRRAEKSLSESRCLLQSTIDALNAQIVLLDGNGKVVTVNEAWLRFGEVNGSVGTDTGVGRDYREVCAAGSRHAEARMVSGPIQDLISGAQAEFGCIYECAQDAEKRSWFQLRMNRFHTNGTPWVVMKQENVTEIKQAHEAQQQLTGFLLRARDDERRRIARDLHDVTAQNLATIKADLRLIERASRNFDEKTLEKIKEAAALSDQIIKELRTLSYLLHPPLLDELGLIPALQWLVRGFTELSGIHVELLLDEDIGRLATDLETALFRVAQESLSNVHLHSGSHTAIICATQHDSSIVLQIADRGRGISRTTSTCCPVAPMPGVGIMGMGERLRQLGGRLEVESDDQGTIVTARVPITTAELCCAS